MKQDNAYFENAGESFSLLYPAGVSAYLELDPAAAHDLGLNEIVGAFAPDRESQIVSSPIDANVEADDMDARQRYKLEMRPPLGQSYAREVAARYGISYQQLENVLTKRGVI